MKGYLRQFHNGATEYVDPETYPKGHDPIALADMKLPCDPGPGSIMCFTECPHCTAVHRARRERLTPPANRVS